MGIAKGSQQAAQVMKKNATFTRAVDAIRDINHQLAACSKIAIDAIGELRGATDQNSTKDG